MKILIGNEKASFTPVSFSIVIESQEELGAIHGLFNHQIIANYLQSHADGDLDIASVVRSVLLKLNNGKLINDEIFFQDLTKRINKK